MEFEVISDSINKLGTEKITEDMEIRKYQDNKGKKNLGRNQKINTFMKKVKKVLKNSFSR